MLHLLSHLPAQGRLCRDGIALLAAAVAAVILTPMSARAQSAYVWGGAGGPITSDYNLGSNWSNPPPGAPPVSAGQTAIFGAVGSDTVNVSGPIAPSSWIFSTDAQFYTISGAPVNFSLAGPSGGLIVNADAGQTISIANNIGEAVAGVQVQVLDSSTLVLSGSNSYSGGTVVSGGTLQANNNNAIGTGTVTLVNGLFRAGGASDLTFSNNFITESGPFGGGFDSNGLGLTISGNIADGSGGPGAITIFGTGGGTVVFAGQNTYSGGTTIFMGANLQLGTLARSASMIGPVTNLGQFDIVNADTSGITSISNDGTFGTVKTIFHNAASATSIAISNIEGGETDFLDSSSAGHAAISNSSSGFFGGITTFGSAGGTDTASAGNATITNTNHGVTSFLAHTSAGNAVITNTQGITAFGDHASAGSATITANSQGSISFSQFATAGNATIITNGGGNTFFQDNATGGNAQFIADGSGTVDFSASAGPNGDHRITAGSIAGSGRYVIGGGNTLVVGGNNLSTIMSGRLLNTCGCGPGGSGSLEKIGAGTLTLSGFNLYTGTTAVNGGTLDVEGSIAYSSLTAVNSGGLLTGAGTVGSATIANGGIFRPGNGLGTFMTVQGNLAFASGALYLLQLNATTSTSAHVTGRASLGGNVGVTIAPGSTVTKQKYTILTAAGGVTGGFGSLAGTPAGLVGTFSYDAHNAYLQFGYGAPSGLNINQGNVATTLGNFFNSTGGLPAAFAFLTPSGLTQASGELPTASQQATFKAMNLFLDLITDPFVTGRDGSASAGGGAQAYAAKGAISSAARDAFARVPAKAELAGSDPFERRWSTWGAAFGGGADTDGHAALGSNASNVRAWGVAAGTDYLVSPATLLGFALSGGGTSFGVSNLGTGRSDLFQAGVYARHNFGAGYITGALTYGGQQVTTDRTVTAAGFERLQARFNANALSGRIEGGYRTFTPWLGVTPYGAGQFTAFRLPAYAEQVLAGPGTFALTYAAKDVMWSRSELGLRTDNSCALQNGLLTLHGRFAWAHDFNTDRAIGAAFQTLPGTFFIVSGAAQSHDVVLTQTSAEMKWRNGWSALASFESELSMISRSYSGKAVARYSW